MLALVDCNNFYVSCERLFQPGLNAHPVIVLSNNDGCVVSRSDEAKALGIGMAVPFYQVAELVHQHKVAVFSSNYALYGDLSNRVVTCLRQFSPSLEMYSVDECFLDLEGCAHRGYREYGMRVRTAVLREVGMSTCVGIARTKALAKVANRVAKKFKERTAGVWVLDTVQAEEKALRWLDIGDVWGIGRRHAKRLLDRGVRKAWDFVQLDEEWIRKNMSIVGLRLQRELKGEACLHLEEIAPAKKSIMTSRSFGKSVSSLEALEEAVATFATQCAAKLRQQGLCAVQLHVFVHSNSFRPEEPQHHHSRGMVLPVATSDSCELVAYALCLLRQIFRLGILYKKAGVLCAHTIPTREVQGNLFDTLDRGRAAQAMKAIDLINNKYGRHTMQLAVQGKGDEWKLKRERLSPSYTTDWDQLLVVQC